MEDEQGRRTPPCPATSPAGDHTNGGGPPSSPPPAPLPALGLAAAPARSSPGHETLAPTAPASPCGAATTPSAPSFGIEEQDGLNASSLDKKRKGTPCQQDGDDRSHAGKIMRYGIPDLPEEVWSHIQSLLPLRDAARSACLSHAFLHSWRCHPNLTLNEKVLRSKSHECEESTSDKIDRILRNHSGIGLRTLKLEGISSRCLDSWLHIAVKPGIEVLTLNLRRSKIKYNIPFSLLSDGVRNSIQHLELGCCAFHPTAELRPLRSLTSLHLSTVRITGDELECFLSNARALEKLIIFDCKEIIYLKIPCVLKQLSHLKVTGCLNLQVIENNAPNLSSIFLDADHLKLSLGETMQMKNLTMIRDNVVCYARAELSSIMPNLETLALSSTNEVVNTPMLPTKFLYLKHLTIHLVAGLTFSPSYDYYSLVSFLDAAPSLETLHLDVCQAHMKHKSVFGDSTHLRQITEQSHFYLKSVKIIGFISAKGLVELACYIIKNAVYLDYMTLDTLGGTKCLGNKDMTCGSISDGFPIEAPRAVRAIREYVEDKVPPTVKLTVVEPCSRCLARAEG